MEKFKKVLSGRQFTYYMTTSLMIVAVIGILVVLNLFLKNKEWKLDLTTEKRYSISEDTKKYLTTDLKKDVNIYVLSFSGPGFGDYYKNIIDEYKNITPKVKVQEFDLDKNPRILNKFQIQSQDPVVVVESGSKFIKIDLRDVNSEYMSQNATLESKITEAINYVANDKEIKVYMLQGHGELQFKDMQSIESRMKDSGMKLEELNLTTKKDIPQDASAIIIAGGKADISDEEKTKIENYLKANGKLMMLAGSPDALSKDKMKNLSAILKSYNIEVQDDIVFETSGNHSVSGYPTIIVPVLTEDEIVSPISKLNLNTLMMSTRSIKILSDKIDGLTVTSLAKTTPNAWGETNLNFTGNERPQPDEKDVKGPMDIIVKAEKVDASKNSSKVIVYGGFVNVLDEQFIQRIGAAGNIELFANGMKWLTDYKGTVNIPAKSFKNQTVSYTASQEIAIIIIVILLPLLFIIGGISVWVVRRRL